MRKKLRKDYVVISRQVVADRKSMESFGEKKVSWLINFKISEFTIT